MSATTRSLPTVHRSWRLVLPLALAAALAAAPSGAVGFTTEFLLESCTWSSKGTQNPYFSLRLGRQLVLEGDDDGAEVQQIITVLRKTEMISFVTDRGTPLTVRARVVEERESEDGELAEVSRNWFARCIETSDIFYFGEEVDIYEDGEIVSSEGAWRAGEGGALPGLIAPGRFLLGAKYFQEQAPGVAEDRGKNADMGLDITVPAGSFTDCVAVLESEPGDSGPGDLKVYCPGVGIVMDEDLVLVEIDVVPAN